MAQNYIISTVTDAGRTAMQTALSGGYAMVFKEMVVGDGTYTSGEDVTARTALKSQQMAYSFSSEVEEDDGVTLKSVITNANESTPITATDFNANEVGIIVTVNSVDYLYALAAVEGDTGTAVPVYTGTNKVEIEQTWFVINTNDAEITVTLAGAYALATDMNEAQAKILAILSDLATVETSTTAANDYLTGQYLVLNNQFYVASTNITAGDTLEVGTNITAKTVGEVLYSANSNISRHMTYITSLIYNFGNYEPAGKAVNAYSIGDLFTRTDGELVKATAAIAVNDSLVENTNYEKVTLDDIVSALNTAIASKVDDTDVIDLAHGGTGATSASAARTNLGLGTAATKDSTTSITNTSSTVATPSAVYNYTRPVVITSSSSSAPSDTRALWVYPA